VIAVDTNILVYAHRPDSPWHSRALDLIEGLAEALAPWSVPWPSIHEFIGIVTHPRVFNPPSPLSVALNQVDAWLESPTLVLLTESGGYWPLLRTTLTSAHVSGPRVHDAKIAALCQLHGITELWSADRDFNRFSNLKIRNPLLS
jgi:toxin-antitoxin system PIN domain toxin